MSSRFMKKIPRYLLVGLLVGLVFQVGIPAQEEDPEEFMPRGAQRVLHIQQFLNSNPGVRFYRSDITPELIQKVYGPAFSFGDNPEASAGNFVVEHSGIFGVNPEDLRPHSLLQDKRHTLELMYIPETDSYKFTQVYFAQYHQDIPVYRAELRLLARNESGSPLVLASSSLRDLGDFTVGMVPYADISPVRQALDAQVPGLIDFSEAEVVIWAGVEDTVDEPRLAYTFVAENGAYDETYGKWRFVVDSITGEILLQESLIHFVDVTGNVTGMASDGPKADFCANEISFALPHARVAIQGGNTVYTDLNGNFTIPNGGSSDVTVQSFMDGLYFTMNDTATSEETLTQVVTPPGPANFIHNQLNLSEFIRSQVNAYLRANIVRDFTLTHHPTYPVISGQTNFGIVVNRTDIYCPGNAWYDGSAINFCRAGSGYPNTGWSSVVYHEYGHHMVETGGSGQDQYGEGMSDCISVLLLDDPILGWGFFGDCNTGLRNADNTYQYPCSGSGHDCGQLISGCIWDTRNALFISDPVNYLTILSGLTVNSIPLHIGSTITPQITIDFLTLDDDDADISNGTPHYNEIDAGFSVHNMPAPPLSLLAFSYPNGRPDIVTPGQTTAVRVVVSGLSATPQSGTGELHYSVDGGLYNTVSMTEVSTNEYDAILPGVDCLSRINWYVSAETTLGTTVNDPDGSPTTSFTALSAENAVLLLDDDFEADLGWTVQNISLDTGAWTRVVPSQGGSRGDPPNDYDGSGRCYVTGNGSSEDVDGGPTNLLSPIFDLTGSDAIISYATWQYNDDGDDSLHIQISNNGGANFTTVETNGPGGAGGWVEGSFLVSDEITPSANMQLRFQSSDQPNDSVTESGVDAVTITTFQCTQDCNNNTIPDDQDISGGTSSDCNSNGIPDECEDLLACDLDVTFTPTSTVIARGQRIHMDVHIENLSLNKTVTVDYWLDAYRINGNPYAGNPVGQTTIVLGPGATEDRHFQPVVPMNAPIGTPYTIYLRVGGAHPSVTVEEFFEFEITAP